MFVFWRVPGDSHESFGQIIATARDILQKVADEGKSPYFRKIQVGEIL